MSIESISRAALPYAAQSHDAVRRHFEQRIFRRTLDGLLREARGGSLLDLGCSDGLARRLAGDRVERYLGLDLAPRGRARFETVGHDLRHGLGPVGDAPFDVYLAGFGLASHLSPGELSRVLREIARHARPGALVALEALGLYSLEWPRLWGVPAGRRRLIRYRLATDVGVHPWSPAELFELFEEAGVHPLRSVDRTIQAGPKVGSGRYWRGLPPVRAALNSLLAGSGAPDKRAALGAELPPLPAGPAAVIHHELARRRRELVESHDGTPAELAEAIWRLEPVTGSGYGHGLLVVGRVA